MPESAMPRNIRPNAPRRGRLGCSGTGMVTIGRVMATSCARLFGDDADGARMDGGRRAAWLRERWEPSSGIGFDYEVHGTTCDDMRVVRSSSTREETKAEPTEGEAQPESTNAKR